MIVEGILRRVKTGQRKIISFEIQDHDLNKFGQGYKTLPEYCLVKISPPKRPRTTGDKSQNHNINGSLQQIEEFANSIGVICEYTGMEFPQLKAIAKERAIKRGYPVDPLPNGWITPKSEADISTIEAGFLIDEIHQMAAEIACELKI